MAVPDHPARKHSPIYRATLRYSRVIHTYLSMLAIVLFMFFGTTGFLLNHPAWFGVDATHTTESKITIPADVLASKDKLTLVECLRARGASGAVEKFDWPEEGEPFHVSFKSPRSQCDADITVPGGETRLTIESHGFTGLMTRLHTSREAGPVWQLLVDATAILLLLVSLTGLILWQSLPKRRMIGTAALVSSILAIVAAYLCCVP